MWEAMSLDAQHGLAKFANKRLPIALGAFHAMRRLVIGRAGPPSPASAAELHSLPLELAKKPFVLLEGIVHLGAR